MRACPHERGLALRCAIIHTMECPALGAVANKLQQRQVSLVCSTERAFQPIGNLAIFSYEAGNASHCPARSQSWPDNLQAQRWNAAANTTQLCSSGRNEAMRTCCMNQCIPGADVMQPSPGSGGPHLQGARASCVERKA